MVHTYIQFLNSSGQKDDTDVLLANEDSGHQSEGDVSGADDEESLKKE